MKKIIQKTFIGLLAMGLSASLLSSTTHAQNSQIINNHLLSKADCIEAMRDSDDEHMDVFTTFLGVGTKSWILKTSAPETPTSSDESVATIECKEKKDGNNSYYIYYVVTHKKGVIHVQFESEGSDYEEGESTCFKVVVTDRFTPTIKNFELKVGETKKTTVLSCSPKRIPIVISENPEIATAKLLNPENTQNRERFISIKAKSEGTTKIILRSKDGKYDVKIKVNVTKDGNYTAVEETTGTRRALVIGQQYCCYNELAACPKDADAMERMCKNGGYTSVTNLYNASKSDIKKGIQETFKDAKEGDVSLFYYSGHGDVGGKICAFNKKNDCSIETISAKQLASWLSNVPGKVIVIMDSCFSGGTINKSANDLQNHEAMAIVNAFSQQDKFAKGGALRSDKFKVLASCNKNQYCYDNGQYGFFTHALISGCGYGYKTGRVNKKAPADLNGDNKLTLEECHAFTAQNANPLSQNAVCYPNKCGFKLFERPSENR